MKFLRKNMVAMVTELDYTHGGITKRVINVPAYKCPSCGNIVLSDSIESQLAMWIGQEESDTVDYEKYQQQEADEFTAINTFFF